MLLGLFTSVFKLFVLQLEPRLMVTQTLFLFLFLSVVHAQNDCQSSYCSGYGLIQSPFWFQSQLPPKKCRFPGFNLSCIDRKTYLNIPYSGIFNVDSIYYYAKRIRLSDPGNCLARRLLSLNLSSSPFMVDHYETYTLFSCPKSRVSSIGVIDCLSNSSMTIVAVKYQASSFQDVSRCEKILTVPVPASLSFLSKSEFPVTTIDLTWITPSIPSTGASDKAITLVVPLVAIPLLILFISVCICMGQRDNHESSHSPTQTNRGLDEHIIESYQKMTITENWRIPGWSNGIACAICLEDYVPNDTLRFMPECEHCFHVECIDKWLRTNRICPICRVSLRARNISPC